MTLDDLIGLTGDKEKAKDIFEVMGDVARFNYFKMSKDLGIVYGPQDISFTDMILFSWIANRKK